MNQDGRKVVSEIVGTFALVFVGAGAVIVESHTGPSHLGLAQGKLGLLGIALAHGCTLATMIYSFGSISGAHFNPAVSFAVWLRQRLSGSLLGSYVAAQFGGAVLAAVCLGAIFPDEIALAGLGTPSLAPNITGLKGVVIESIISFFLVTTVLFSTRKDNEDKAFAGIAIGATLVGLILFAGPLTGASANPARYFGPALVSGNLSQIAVYFVGPLVGGSLASFAFAFVSPPSSGPERTHVRAPGPPRGEDSMEVPSGAPQAAPSAVLARLRQAQDLFRTGHGTAAAALLVPVLVHLESFPREVADSVRSLLIVIEEEQGPIELLSAYHGLIYPRGSQVPH